ncbi:HAD superfamily phosphoserine phosphatase-like hydrolase [Erwinia toletana]|uniref:phosphoserine phosphatase n=1 Tax=Winslowiella toletana TaxID=92490 RepID=A0ABS4P398_9GAMM|nr:HAD family phosphatase [Winslowiella toletana]MBP2167134.1 HAD superfamily phosphoserine phosphatase-like hydrolase [Winslowiella toletana]
MTTAYCFDLDGTLTRQELLPLIASSVGLDDEISVLTEATIAGLLPFEKSFKLRVRLLKDANLGWIHDALETRVEFQSAILNFIQQHPGQCFVITGNLDLWVKPLLNKLGIQSFTSIAELNQGGQLCGVKHILNKSDAIRTLRQHFDHIVAVGEGMNDVPMFEEADWRIAFGATHEPNKVLCKLSDFIVYDGSALCRLLNML